jgi:hypothetical protein
MNPANQEEAEDEQGANAAAQPTALITEDKIVMRHDVDPFNCSKC